MNTHSEGKKHIQYVVTFKTIWGESKSFKFEKVKSASEFYEKIKRSATAKKAKKKKRYLKGSEYRAEKQQQKKGVM